MPKGAHNEIPALPGAHVRDVVAQALREDIESGDITCAAVLPAGVRGEAKIFSRQPGVLAGVDVARECFRQLDLEVEFGEQDLQDGARLENGTVVTRIRGDVAALLSAERTALNFLQRLSGIATRTRRYVDAVDGLPTRILDTRKTTPLLRVFEKHAVRVGGGVNHRFGLFDQVMLKENHFDLAGGDYEATVRLAVRSVESPVVAEAQTIAEALAAVRGGAAVILLDNFAPDRELARAVESIRHCAKDLGATVEIEASGGVTLETVRAFAECGVDRISVGALTHSVEALDLSMLTKDPS